MADLESVDAYLENKPEAVALFRRFEESSSGAARPSPLRGARSSTGSASASSQAFVERRRLELNIDHLREAEHPCQFAAFHTTKRVVTHRLRIAEEAQLDDSIAALLVEAYDDVGPGTRGR